MSQDPPRHEDERAMMLAFFRYGVIAPIVEVDRLAPGQTREIIKAITEQTHFLPGKGPISVKERTFYQWAASGFSVGDPKILWSMVHVDSDRG